MVSRSSLAERQKVTLEAEVGANELCHAHNASGTARLQDHVGFPPEIMATLSFYDSLY